MQREFMQYLAAAFPEGIYNGFAPEGAAFPYLTVTQTDLTPDDGLDRGATRSRVAEFEVTAWAVDRNTLAALVERLRLRVDRVGDVFDLWGVRVGVMKIAGEDAEEEYELEDGETVIVSRTIRVFIHYERN
jgi:hypothetical protein